MPHITPGQTRDSAAESPAEPSRQSSPLDRPVGGSDNPAPKPGKRGALFRALVNAGCDMEAAYNADVEVGSMAAENVVAQLGAQFQVGFLELKQICKENAERLAEHSQKLEALTEAGIERDRKLEVFATEVTGLKEVFATEVTGLKEVFATEVTGLKEASGTRMDALKMELRLVWGALGVLVTVLLAVFGFLFTR